MKGGEKRDDEGGKGDEKRGGRREMKMGEEEARCDEMKREGR